MGNTIDAQEWEFVFAWLAASFLFGAFSAIGGMRSARSTNTTRDFYESLDKPRWAPRPLVYSIVWAILYTLIGLGGFFVRREAPWQDNTAALALILVTLGVSSTWSWFFVRGQMLLAAFIVTLLSLALSIVAAVLAYLQTVVGGALLTPLPIWLMIASILSGVIWKDNRGVRPRRLRKAKGAVGAVDEVQQQQFNFA